MPVFFFLKELDLSHNEFKYLNRDEFGGLGRLEILHLDGNQISGKFANFV